MSQERNADSNPTTVLVHLSKKLASIGSIKKCESCSCYIDTIKEFDAVLRQEEVPAPVEVYERIAELDARHQTAHGCIGCDPCYPVAVSNALYEISGGRSSIDGTSKGCCDDSCSLQERESLSVPVPRLNSWPIEAGDYRLGNPSGSVAVATLASDDLYRKLSDSCCAASCSICGKVFTENIGIEKVVKNIISNRHIRFLILCGREAKGHETGRCIKALHGNGLNERGRIADAPGKRPWIKTLTASQIARFQEQIEIVDMIGCEDTAVIEAAVAELSARNPGATANDVIAEGVPHYIADDNVRLQLDRAGFLIIHPKPEADWIMVEHYKNTGEPTCVIEGSDPAIICAELIKRGLVSQLDHAAYLGRELERAKLSMLLDMPFAQDRAFGQLDPSSVPEW